MSSFFDENETIQFYDLFYQGDIGPEFTKEEIDLILGVVRKSDLSGLKILDVGAGTGRIAIELAKLGAEITALDVLPNAKKVYDKKFSELNLVSDYRISDFSEFETDEKFDLIIMFWNTFSQMALDEYFSKDILLRVQKYLRPSGKVIIEQDDPETFNPGSDIVYRESKEGDCEKFELEYKTAKFYPDKNITEEVEKITRISGDKKDIFQAKITHKWWGREEMIGLMKEFFGMVEIKNIGAKLYFVSSI